MRNKSSVKIALGVAILCLAASATVHAGQGLVKREIWKNVTLTEVGNLQQGIDWIATHPASFTDTLTLVDWPTRSDNYVARVTGYIIPPVSGTYIFNITSDDASGFWLSSGASLPSTITLASRVCGIDSYTGYHGWNDAYKSTPITLQGGQAYGFVAIMQEGGGEDHLSLAWTNTAAGIANNTILAGAVLSDTNPQFASEPVPANGALNIPIETVELGWTAPWADPSPVYTIRFSKNDPNTLLPVVASGETSTAFTVNDLDASTTYYWRVDTVTVDPNNKPVTYNGPLWHFTTAPLRPIITVQPTKALVYAGETVAFEIETYSANGAPLTYTWRKDGMAIEPAVNAATLTIENAQFADEGEYNCKVTNAAGEAVSASVTLTTKRTVGHWKFEGNANDSSLSGNHATLIGTATEAPTWTPGIDGNALRISSGGRPYAEVAPEAAGDFNLTERFSASVWIKSAGSPNAANADGFACLVGKHITSADRPWLIRQFGATNAITFKTHDNFDNFNKTAVFDNKWHLVTATWDMTTGTKSVYVDGRLADSITSDVYTNPTQSSNTSPLRIGYYKDNYVFSDTLLDDVRIYNYALNAYEVAALWVAFHPGDSICVEQVAMDLNDDCRIDLQDFALLAEAWMQCNRNPLSECP